MVTEVEALREENERLKASLASVSKALTLHPKPEECPVDGVSCMWKQAVYLTHEALEDAGYPVNYDLVNALDSLDLLAFDLSDLAEDMKKQEDSFSAPQRDEYVRTVQEIHDGIVKVMRTIAD